MPESTRAPYENPPAGSEPSAAPPLLYFPDFLRGRVADELYCELVSQSHWRQEEIIIFGRQLPQPRLTCWYGLGLSALSRYRQEHPAQPWSKALAQVREEVERVCGMRFNSCLVNLYRDGRDCMGWHSDDEPSWGARPLIASVSLGAPRDFDLRERAPSRRSVRLRLEHGSLLVMLPGTQEDWVHSVPRRLKLKEPRINLTFRQIVTTAASPARASEPGWEDP